MQICQTEQKRIGFLFFNMLLTNTYILDLISNFKAITDNYSKLQPFSKLIFSQIFQTDLH